MKHKRPPTDVWQDDPAVPAHDEALDRLHTERLGLLAAMVQDLRAENERLRAHDADQRAALAQQEGEIERMRGAGQQAEADAAALRAALAKAQADVCSLNCPSTWRTADGPPPHSEQCQAISAALAADHPGAALLAELEAARAVVDAAREPLAAYSHDSALGGWMRYQFSKGTLNTDGTWTMPTWAVERWARQMNTPYAELPEDEKRSDRKEADEMLSIVRAALAREGRGSVKNKSENV